MRRALAVAAVLLACRRPDLEPPSAEEIRALPRAFAEVVDDLADVKEAGAIELRAMKKALALTARIEEPDMRSRSRSDWTRASLLAEPGAFRGDAIFVNGLVAQLITLGELNVAVVMSVPDRTLFAFALPGGARAREGQMVWESGFFFKRWVLKARNGGFLSCPLAAGTVPTRSRGSFPVNRALAACGLAKLFPLIPAGGLTNARLVLVAREDGHARFEGHVVEDLAPFLRAREEKSVVLRKFALTPAEAVARVQDACRAAGKKLVVVEILAE